MKTKYTVPITVDTMQATRNFKIVQLGCLLTDEKRQKQPGRLVCLFSVAFCDRYCSEKQPERLILSFSVAFRGMKSSKSNLGGLSASFRLPFAVDMDQKSNLKGLFCPFRLLWV